MDIGTVVKEFLKKRGSNVAECTQRLGFAHSNIYDKCRRGTFYVSDLEKIAAAYGYEVEIKFVKPRKQD